MYASKLSQIKSRSKGNKKAVESEGKVRQSKNEDQVDGKMTPKGKMSELKKRLEENK